MSARAEVGLHELHKLAQQAQWERVLQKALEKLSYTLRSPGRMESGSIGGHGTGRSTWKVESSLGGFRKWDYKLLDYLKKIMELCL